MGGAWHVCTPNFSWSIVATCEIIASKKKWVGLRYSKLYEACCPWHWAAAHSERERCCNRRQGVARWVETTLQTTKYEIRRNQTPIFPTISAFPSGMDLQGGKRWPGKQQSHILCSKSVCITFGALWPLFWLFNLSFQEYITLSGVQTLSKTWMIGQPRVKQVLPACRTK